MSERSTSTDRAEHDGLWNDRLQDWLDGDLVSVDSASFEAHLADCPRCQTQLTDFEQLDAALKTAAPPIALDAAFDARLSSQIDAMDESSRLQARQRMEAELQANLQSLSRRWRQNLAFIIPSVVAGVALALALVGWFDNSGASQQLATEGAHEFGRQVGSYLPMLFTGLLGAGIGLAVANWLAPAAE